ncbi:L,D-transpeptidase [Sphingomonas sp. RT2P30]|uniref:L,D-transpeptidase n=1 Tax=Parasphingomonas halimpatiens TaxID=3096162 RepID=UPI002FC87A21
MISTHCTATFAFIALVAAAACATPAAAAERTPPERASFAEDSASAPASALASWAVATGDNHALPFVIVDKVAAKLFLFDRHGTLRAATAVLVGLARGDISPPGIGNRKLSQIAPADRITPAGRFIGEKGINLAGRGIVWVDYDTAIAIHRVTDVKPGMTSRDRLSRLSSVSPSDRRISLGCINVSEAFYDAYIRPTFDASSAVVYILPEAKALNDVFAIPAAFTVTTPTAMPARG